jgi:hypothetical protein
MHAPSPSDNEIGQSPVSLCGQRCSTPASRIYGEPLISAYNDSSCQHSSSESLDVPSANLFILQQLNHRLIHDRTNYNQLQCCISICSIGCFHLFCLGSSVELRAVLDRIMSPYRRRYLPRKNQRRRAWKQWLDINI